MFGFRSRALIVVFLNFSGSAAWAAPCCSSNAAAPSLISGDHATQFTFTTSQSSVIGDAPSSGPAVFRSSSDSEVTRTYRIDYASVISDLYQAGVSLPIVSRNVETNRKTDSATHIGDIRITGTYEFLPEWSYSAWKPKGYAFLQYTLPTGRSIYESRSILAADATGEGFHTITAGALFVKTYRAWDFSAVPEIHRSLNRTFSDTAGESVSVAPGMGASLAVGAGYSPRMGNLRVGLRLQPVVNASKTVRSTSGVNETGFQKTWNTSLELSYLISDEWSVNSSYTDQTLLGPARNSTLSRTFALGLQMRNLR